jgi:chorismate synthase
MPGNVFGELFRVAAFGESHGAAIGCVIDGCPAGLALAISDIEKELQRRRPGQGGASSSRNEKDEPEILSGVFEGKTLGTPIAILIRNTDQRSNDYDELRDIFRPGHADWAWDAKYGLRDHRGGGRSSGRETACRVAAGAVAKVFLATQGISVQAKVLSIAGIEDEEKALAKIEELRAQGDSAGGVVSCVAQGMPPGLGEPVFDKLQARLAAATLSIGGCTGFEYGAGFAVAAMRGSECNRLPNGISGGISSGQPIEFKAAFRPPASISQKQQALDRQGNTREIAIAGRHDICIVPRAAPVVEAMAALCLADFVLLHRAAKL